MVARHFCAELTGPDLYHRLRTNPQGTTQGAIVRELRRAGVKANIRYDVGFDRIVREIGRDKLLIGYLFDAEHWLVIYGYGRRPDRVFVADPRPQQQCEHRWDEYGHRLGNFGIVCSAARPVAKVATPVAKTGSPIPLGPSSLATDNQLLLPFGWR
jgi:ABC-type bacteriocin/lantibiotic exporter with double-glycine peptidase domain